MKKTSLFRAAIAMLIAVNMLSFAACSQQNTSTDSSSVTTSSSATASSSEQTTVYGKVTAVDGSKVTIALGTLNQQITVSGSNDTQQGGPVGGNQGDNQQGETTSGTNSGSNNIQQGTAPSGGPGAADLTLTGASKTITISDASILTKQNRQGRGGHAPDAKTGASTTASGAPNGNAKSTSGIESENSTDRKSGSDSAALTDITVGSILKVTYTTSSETLISVEIVSSAGGNLGGQLSSGTK